MEPGKGRGSMYRQELQVPKMEVLSLIRLFLGWVFPYISRIHTAYIGEDSCILGTKKMVSECIFFFLVHPWKITWNPKMKVWGKMIFFFKQVIWRFHVDFLGCSLPPPKKTTSWPLIRLSRGHPSLETNSSESTGCRLSQRISQSSSNHPFCRWSVRVRIVFQPSISQVQIRWSWGTLSLRRIYILP